MIRSPVTEAWVARGSCRSPMCITAGCRSCPLNGVRNCRGPRKPRSLALPFLLLALLNLDGLVSLPTDKLDRLTIATPLCACWVRPGHVQCFTQQSITTYHLHQGVRGRISFMKWEAPTRS